MTIANPNQNDYRCVDNVATTIDGQTFVLAIFTDSESVTSDAAFHVEVNWPRTHFERYKSFVRKMLESRYSIHQVKEVVDCVYVCVDDLKSGDITIGQMMEGVLGNSELIDNMDIFPLLVKLFDDYSFARLLSEVDSIAEDLVELRKL